MIILGVKAYKHTYLIHWDSIDELKKSLLIDIDDTIDDIINHKELMYRIGLYGDDLGNDDYIRDVFYNFTESFCDYCKRDYKYEIYNYDLNKKNILQDSFKLFKDMDKLLAYLKIDLVKIFREKYSKTMKKLLNNTQYSRVDGKLVTNQKLNKNVITHISEYL